jgi:hypothetical protein
MPRQLGKRAYLPESLGWDRNERPYHEVQGLES